MLHSHVISRLKERYGIDADKQFISNLRTYISKRHSETSPNAVVMYLETRNEGALFRVRLNDFQYHKTKDEILVITNSSFVPVTVIPFSDAYKRLVSSFDRRRKRRKPTPVFNRDDINNDRGSRGQIQRRLKDHYGIELTDEIWSNLNDRRYVSIRVKVIGKKCSRYGRIVINRKEVFVILHNGTVKAVIPPSFIEQEKLKGDTYNSQAKLISEAIKRIHLE